jgi:exodeoxyribonuclease-3
MKIVSWNVNGLRSILAKGLLRYLAREKPDILCLQEIRCLPGDCDACWPDGYEMHWNPADRKGYSGTAILSRTQPLAVKAHLDMPEHDREGRVLTAEYPGFYLVNVYTPNAKRDLSRLPYRQRWDRDFLAFLQRLERRKPVIFCGDLNVAHTAIDLANPKSNVKNHGFTPEERHGFDRFVAAGFVDSFRVFDNSGGHYTWWSNIGNARARNVGWRMDYVLVSGRLRPQLKNAFIRPEVVGSDHCPVGIEIAASPSSASGGSALPSAGGSRRGSETTPARRRATGSR